MRPIKLVMSAFGSYGGEEVVDFSKIKGGLFLYQEIQAQAKRLYLMV